MVEKLAVGTRHNSSTLDMIAKTLSQQTASCLTDFLSFIPENI